MSEMQRIRLIGGMSAPRQISLVSDQFISTASCSKDGEISCKIKPLSALTKRLLQKDQQAKSTWTPEIFKKFAFMLSTPTSGVWALLFPLSILMIMTGYGLLLIAGTYGASGVGLNPYLFWMMLSLSLLFVNRNVATWHAAEHMTIAAYERFGASDMSTIAQQDTYHAKCGGRFFMPLMMVNLSVTLLASWLGISSGVVILLISLILIELVFRFDRKVGLDKFPPTAMASYYLQKYITTRRPYAWSEELLTAQRALQELIAAHV